MGLTRINTMPKAEIITIGTEILLGEIVDTNTRTIARALRDEGVDLYWTSTVGDNIQRIADSIILALKRSELIILTGGLGPTIDDPTRGAVALAYGVELEYHDELWSQVLERFSKYGKVPTENNKRQAYLPHGAIAIENPVGTAPAFMMENESNTLIALPGVPAEMEHLLHNNILPHLRKKFKLEGIIKTRILKTAGVGESIIDEKIADLEEGNNPTLGLSAHAGAVDLRITAKASSEREADALIQELEKELRKRLGDWIYGADEDNLADVALKNLEQYNWKLTTVETGLNGQLEKSLSEMNNSLYLGGEQISLPHNPEELKKICQERFVKVGADICLGVMLWKEDHQIKLQIISISTNKESSLARSYGGAEKMAENWALSLSINHLRRLADRLLAT